MRRRLACVSLILAIMLSPLPAFAETDWYRDTALTLTEKVGDLIHDDVYLLTVLDNTPEHLVALWEVDFTQATRMYRLSMRQDEVLSYLSEVSENDMADLTDAAVDKIEREMPIIFIDAFNQSENILDADTIEMISYRQTFQMSDDFSPCLMIVELMNQAVVGVAFTISGDDTVTATAKLMLPDGNALSVLSYIAGTSVPWSLQQVQ